MNYGGIDLANVKSAVCVIDEDDGLLREVSVPTEAGALAVVVRDYLPLQVVIEASPLAEWTAAVLEAAGCAVVVIDPRAAKHLVRSKKKTDARDARTLARLSRSGWYTAVHRKSPAARAERSRLQGRVSLMKTAKATAASIRGLLRAHGIRLGPTSVGAFATAVRARVAAELPELAATFEELLVVWERAEAGAQALEKAVAVASHADGVRQRLQSVPGVGPLTSSVYVATIDDPRRFRRGEEVADYIGLVPSVYQSGDTDYRGRITREGDGLLRWHLVEAATVLLTRGADCALKRWGLGLQQRKGVAKARVAVARKLAVLLWRLWVRGERFEPWPQAA